MNKLTITDKVFVPVSVDDGLPTSIIEDKKVFALANDSLFVATKIEDGFKLKDEREYSHLEYEATHWLKEETNKYVLSREELEKVISDAIQFGISKQSSFEICGGKNIKLIDLTNEFLNSIL
jgi:hypothetical protein